MAGLGITAKLRAAGARLALWVRNHTRKTIRWLRGHPAWLWKARFSFLTGLVVVTSIGVSVWWPCEQTVRYAGLVLQLLGIGMVAWGIRETRKLFGHPSFWSQVGQWWRSRPKYGAGTVIAIGAAGVTVAGGAGRASVWNKAAPDATLEQRVEALEKNLMRVRDNLSDLQNMTDNEVRRLDQAVDHERQLRARADQELDTKLRDTATGGLYISAMGATWLFVGVTMGTVPAEIAGILQAVTSFGTVSIEIP